MQDKNTIDRHHLLEIILWPNGDGTFTEIRNSAERLKEMGIYDDYKLTIPLMKAEHTRLHKTGITRTFSIEHRRKLSEVQKGKPSPTKGKTMSAETRAKMRKPHKKFSDETRKKMSEAQKCRHTQRRT